MSNAPLEFMQRLAALVPRPRLHLIRCHGVLAPNARLRAAIVPGPAENTSEHAAEHTHGAPARMSWARLLKRVFAIDVEHCPQCGGALKIIAAIEEPAVIAKIARFSPNTVRLTACRAGDKVADSEKGGLNFLFADILCYHSMAHLGAIPWSPSPSATSRNAPAS